VLLCNVVVAQRRNGATAHKERSDAVPRSGNGAKA